MTTNRTDLEQQMASRIRKHLLTSIGGIVLAIVTIAVLGAILSQAVSPKAAPIAALLGIAMIPAIGFWSTFRNLRCPSCNALVAFQVSSNFSLFRAYANKSCNGCNQKIFADDAGKRFMRAIAIIAVVFIALGFLSAILVARSPRPPPAVTSPAP